MAAVRRAQHHFSQDLQTQDEARCGEILAGLRGALPFNAEERRLAQAVDAWR